MSVCLYVCVPESDRWVVHSNRVINELYIIEFVLCDSIQQFIVYRLQRNQKPFCLLVFSPGYKDNITVGMLCPHPSLP